MPPYQTQGERANQCVTSTYKVNPPTRLGDLFRPPPSTHWFIVLKGLTGIDKAEFGFLYWDGGLVSQEVVGVLWIYDGINDGILLF